MKKFFNEAKGHMMTGIGYMLPLIDAPLSSRQVK